VVLLRLLLRALPYNRIVISIDELKKKRIKEKVIPLLLPLQPMNSQYYRTAFTIFSFCFPKDKDYHKNRTRQE
jgi:hypothetical protein